MTDKPSILQLLPALYRRRDAPGASGAGDRALLALTTVLEDVRSIVEQDIAGLYRNWFVETCDAWVLPYIGDLVGQEPFELEAQSPRPVIADAIAFRRRKGCVPSTERRLADLTGWPVQIDDRDSMGPVQVRVWRQQAFAVSHATPRPAVGSKPGRYHFSPFGLDIPLFSTPRPYPGIEAPFHEELDAPTPLTRAATSEQLVRSTSVYLFGDGSAKQIPAEAMVAGDLSHWRIPAPVSGESPPLAVIDPELGRLALVDAPPRPLRVAVSYAYAASASIGGGPYERVMTAPSDKMWVAYVHSAALAAAAKGDPPAFPTLGASLAAYAAIPGSGLIRILDSASYDIAGVRIGGEPEGCSPDPNAPRQLIIEALSGEIPCISGSIVVNGVGAGVHLALSGLWIDGELAIGGDATVDIRDCSIRPRASDQRSAAIVASGAGPHPPRIALSSSVTGPIKVEGDVSLMVSDSVVDGGRRGDAIAGHADARLDRTTVLGRSEMGQLDAVDVIFNDRVAVSDISRGAIRTSYVPQGSRTPRCVDCAEPATPLEFVSVDFGQPDYARLADGVSPAIVTGGSGGSEMGTFHVLHTATREKLLETALEAYCPVDLNWRTIWK
jgi:hypothetical protein